MPGPARRPTARKSPVKKPAGKKSPGPPRLTGAQLAQALGAHQYAAQGAPTFTRVGGRQYVYFEKPRVQAISQNPSARAIGVKTMTEKEFMNTPIMKKWWARQQAAARGKKAKPKPRKGKP